MNNNNIDWNSKQQVLAAVKQKGSALEYASEELKNDKDVVLAAVNQDGDSLEYASEEIQNDLKLLNLLHNFFILPENKIENENTENQQWFENRMKIRDILTEQNLMQHFIPHHTKLVKEKIFKF